MENLEKNKKIKFKSLDELYNDLDYDSMLNIDLVKNLCDLSNKEFVLFFYLIYKECGFWTCEGFFVDKETVGQVIQKIQDNQRRINDSN